MTSIPVAISRFSDNNFKRLYLKNERIFLVFYCISEMCMKLRIFRKTRRVSQFNYCWYYCIRKRFLLKRLKGLASTHYCFNTLFGNQRVNGFETLLKLARHYYLLIFPRIRDKLSWKKSALVTSEIFRLFVNTLTPNDKYSRRNMQILEQQIQTNLSQKGKTFFRFFIAFLKCGWNLEHSEKKKGILA